MPDEKKTCYMCEQPTEQKCSKCQQFAHTKDTVRGVLPEHLCGNCWVAEHNKLTPPHCTMCGAPYQHQITFFTFCPPREDSEL